MVLNEIHMIIKKTWPTTVFVFKISMLKSNIDTNWHNFSDWKSTMSYHIVKCIYY